MSDDDVSSLISPLSRLSVPPHPGHTARGRRSSCTSSRTGFLPFQRLSTRTRRRWNGSRRSRICNSALWSRENSGRGSQTTRLWRFPGGDVLVGRTGPGGRYDRCAALAHQRSARGRAPGDAAVGSAQRQGPGVPSAVVRAGQAVRAEVRQAESTEQTATVRGLRPYRMNKSGRGWTSENWSANRSGVLLFLIGYLSN